MVPGRGRGKGNAYLAARHQGLVHGLDDGATWMEVGAWVLAVLAQLAIADLQENHDKLMEVRDDQAQLLVQGAGVGAAHSSSLLCKALRSQGWTLSRLPRGTRQGPKPLGEVGVCWPLHASRNRETNGRLEACRDLSVLLRTLVAMKTSLGLQGGPQEKAQKKPRVPGLAQGSPPKLVLSTPGKASPLRPSPSRNWAIQHMCHLIQASQHACRRDRAV